MNTMPKSNDRITSLSASPMEIVVDLSEGNPGAANVIMKMMEKPEEFLTVLLLDTYNIYGSHIWVGYKDYAKEDIDVFIEALKDSEKRSDMIKVILDNS